MRPGGFRVLASACFIEWRYFAVLSAGFHGIIGLSIVNPQRRFPLIAEGGLLLLVAGVLDQPELEDQSQGAAALSAPGVLAPAELCWMHLFALEHCRFDPALPGSLDADDGRCRLSLRQPTAASATLHLEAGAGLSLRVAHRGLGDSRLAPALAPRLDGPLSGLVGSHWQVDCASPVAQSSGELRLSAELLPGLAESPGGAADSYASPALREQLGTQQSATFRWDHASGYAEHSYGVRPLPLHGWDFLFAPCAETGQGVVLQTYRGSPELRYLDVVWRQDGQVRSHRFTSQALELQWLESTYDPVLGVVRPMRRLITARSGDLRIRVESRVLRQIPMLRRQRLAVRHFFISEEIGRADWRLETLDGRCLAEVSGQRCGGELAHFRIRAPWVKHPRNRR